MMLSVLASGLAGYNRKLELIFMLRWVSPDGILIGRFIKTDSDWLETFLSQFLMMFASEITFGAFISYSMEILGPRLVFKIHKLGTCSNNHFENQFQSGRSWIGVIANFTGSFGMVLCSILAYFITDWKRWDSF